MVNTNTTRRSLLRLGTGALAFGAVSAALAAAGPATAQAKDVEPTGVSPELARLIADWTAQDEAFDRWYDEVYNPAVDREDALRAAIPHVTMDATLEGNGERVWSTTRRADIAVARGFTRIAPKDISDAPAWQEKRRRARSFYAAHLRRERALKQISATSGVQELRQPEDAFVAAMRPVREAAFAFPVASIVDRAAKLAFVERAGGMDGDDLFARLSADVRRLTWEA